MIPTTLLAKASQAAVMMAKAKRKLRRKREIKRIKVLKVKIGFPKSTRR